LEYVEDVSTCSDCGVPLVAALTPPVPPPDVEWVALASLPNEVQGRMLDEELRRRGIPTLLKTDVFVSGFGRQGTTISVPVEHADAAKQLYGELIGDG